MLKLSQKYKEFLQTKCKREFLEGTTAAGKTTVGIFKFMCMVADSENKYHIIAGDDVGTVEKNVINSERTIRRYSRVLAKGKRQNKITTYKI